MYEDELIYNNAFSSNVFLLVLLNPITEHVSHVHTIANCATNVIN